MSTAEAEVKCPSIITYESADARPKQRFIAVFAASRLPLPMVFYGSTRDGVIAAAALFWSDQQTIEARKAVNNAARASRMRSAAK